MALESWRPRRLLLRSFFICLGLAVVMFLPFLVIDKGFFLYCGDFNSQQQPFTYYMEGLVKGGLPQYAWATDLGSGFIESYSFYLLGSPFFWLGSLLPQAWSPYLLVPLLCLKFAVAGTGAALWARRYTRTDDGALLAAILYAFSGFSIYNIFFNHFVDVVAVFPFLLWSVDAFFEEDRRGPFALMTALCLLVNYFFFVGQVLFVVLYFFMRVGAKDWRPGWRRFWLFCLEAVLGVGLAMVMALPSAYAVLQNPRVDNFSTGLDILFYWRTQQYLAIITSALLPQDPSYLPNLFPDCSIKWTSMSLYLPCVSMTGVLVWLKNHKKRPFYRLLLLCGVMALVPVLNAAFYAFNSSYYCRWYYMPLLVMAMATAGALEEAPRAEWLRCTRVVGAVTAAYLLFGLLPDKDGEGNFQLGVEEDPLRFFLTLALAVGGLAVLYALLTSCHDRRSLLRCTAVCAGVLGVVVGMYTITCGKYPQRYGDADYKMECYDYRLELQDWLEAADENYFRIDTYESYTNLGLWLDRSCLQFFNSTVDASILEFYPSVGVKRDVSSKPEQKQYALRGLLNARYLLMPSDRLADFREEALYNQDWEYATVIGPYVILENTQYVPFGTTYQYYITLERYEEMGENSRAGILLRALVLDPEQVERYGDRLQPLPESSINVVNYTAYLEDCADRRATACDRFVTDGDGFSASITTEAPQLVFFSIPYNAGWHATVNGQPAAVEKVDKGLLAIPVGAGKNEIRMDYRAPGLAAGQTISLISLVMLAVYLGLVWLLRRRGLLARAAHAVYIEQPLPAWELSPHETLPSLEELIAQQRMAQPEHPFAPKGWPQNEDVSGAGETPAPKELPATGEIAQAAAAETDAAAAVDIETETDTVADAGPEIASATGTVTAAENAPAAKTPPAPETAVPTTSEISDVQE